MIQHEAFKQPIGRIEKLRAKLMEYSAVDPNSNYVQTSESILGNALIGAHAVTIPKEARRILSTGALMLIGTPGETIQIDTTLTN